MTIEEAINALIMCQELMLFDPMTGETHELWKENRDNQDLYNACTIAIAALQEKAGREKGCDYCNGENVIPCKNCDDHILTSTPCNEFMYCQEFYK